MIAGTIVVGGGLGAYAGAAMRRGSISRWAAARRSGSGFVDCGVHELVFLRLLARHLDALGLDALARRIGPLRRFAGDGRSPEGRAARARRDRGSGMGRGTRARAPSDLVIAHAAANL